MTNAFESAIIIDDEREVNNMTKKEREIICKHVNAAWRRLQQYEKEHSYSIEEDEQQKKLLRAWGALYSLAEELGIKESTWLQS